MPAKIRFVHDDNTTRPFPDAFEVDQAEFKINGDYVCVEPCGGGGSCNIFEGYDETIPYRTIDKISGTDHTLIIKHDGTLWGTGRNCNGSLGIGWLYGNQNSFIQIGTDTDWADVFCGTDQSVAIKNDGSVWVTGLNDCGQLGLGDEDNRYYFTEIPDTDWNILMCGYKSTVGIKNDGTLWAAGRNYNGQLGFGDGADRDVFTQVGTDTDWDQVDQGTTFSMALKTDGTLWCCGLSWHGQHGTGLGNVTSFTQVGTDTDWSIIKTGSAYSIAIKTDGTLWGTGLNYGGELGLGDNLTRYFFEQVGSVNNWDDLYTGGGSYTFALRNNNQIWCTGANHHGQLGLGDEINRNVFEQVGTDTDWDIICVAGSNTFMVKDNGNLYGTGRNSYGQLGFGDQDSRNVFTSLTKDVVNTIHIDETTTTPGLGQYGTPFNSLKVAFEWLRETCVVVPDDITLTILLQSNLDISESNYVSLNHSCGYNMILNGNGYLINYIYSINDENSNINSRLRIYDNHSIRIQNLKGNIYLYYSTVPFTGDAIIVLEGDYELNAGNSTTYYLDVNPIRAKHCSVLNLFNCTFDNTETEIMVIEINYHQDYKIIRMNKKPYYYNKSIGVLEDYTSDNIIIDMSTIEIPNLIYDINDWIAKNNSTVVINYSSGSPTIDIDEQNSTVIVNGVVS